MPPSKKANMFLRWDERSVKGARRKLLAVYLGLGYSVESAAAKCGMSKAAVQTLCADPAFVALVDNVAQTHIEVMEELLENAEVKAIETLTGLLTSDSDEVRLKAATNLLDRAGRRGAIVTRVEQKTVQHTTEVKGDLNEALSKALLDPGVRRWLSAQPGFESAVNPANLLPVVGDGSGVQRVEGGSETVVIPSSEDLEPGGDVHDSGADRLDGSLAPSDLPE